MRSVTGTRVTITRTALTAALAAVKPAAGRKGLIAVTVRPGTLTVDAGDAKWGAAASIRIATRTTNKVAVRAAALTRALAVHRADLLHLAVNEKFLEISSGPSTTVLSGQLDERKPIHEPAGAAEHPFGAHMAAAAVKVARFASPDKGYRPILEAVSFDGQHIVATDSYRLGWAGPFRPLPKMLVPAPALLHAAKVCADGTYTVDATHVMFLSADGCSQVSAELTGGEYPNWRQLVTTRKQVDRAMFTRREVIDALTRCLKIRGSDDTKPLSVTRSTHGQAVLALHAADGVVVHTERVAASGNWPTFGVNPEFLRDGLKACTSDRVAIRAVDALKPLQIDDGTFSYLLMPVRLTWATSESEAA